MKKFVLSAVLIAVIVGACAFDAEAKPLKVYILAGQSNMQGHAKTTTFDYMALDPKTAPILKEMRNADGSPLVCDKVWISSIEGPMQGKLKAGYGASARGPKIGPEFTFGIYMQKIVNEPILIIKTAWGGKSLHTDFRSPSGGAYQFNKSELETYKKKGKDINKAKAEKIKVTGHYYRLMIEHVKSVLKNPKKVCPAYNAKEGYELAGFVWFQGWNDMVGRSTYPNRDKPGGYDLYSKLMEHFIRDVRKDLSAPKMPFVIGVMGVGGVENTKQNNFRQAMAAPAKLPEFKGNVTAVLTEKCWDAKLGELIGRWNKVKSKSRSLKKSELTKAQQKAALDKFKAQLYTPKEVAMKEKGASNAGYHYLGSAKILAQIGKAFAEALGEMK